MTVLPNEPVPPVMRTVAPDSERSVMDESLTAVPGRARLWLACPATCTIRPRFAPPGSRTPRCCRFRVQVWLSVDQDQPNLYAKRRQMSEMSSMPVHVWLETILERPSSTKLVRQMTLTSGQRPATSKLYVRVVGVRRHEPRLIRVHSAANASTVPDWLARQPPRSFSTNPVRVSRQFGHPRRRVRSGLVDLGRRSTNPERQRPQT